MKIILSLIAFLVIYKVQSQELISPCPRLFQYEPKGPESDRWYGTVTLISDADLNGVWLRLLFNKPSIQLGNWFGEVVTTDNKEYLVKNRNQRLVANTPFKVRFYIKYNPTETPPILVLIRLNAKTICPENAVPAQIGSSTGQLLTSMVISTTPSLAVVRPQPPAAAAAAAEGAEGGASTFVIQGGAGFQRPSSGSGDEDDFFQGDFAVVNKPSSTSNFDDAACGTVINSPRPLITYGQGTQEGEFPWHAALYHAKGIDLTYFCGASLVTRTHLITVAHCVTRRKSQTPISPEDMVVYLGKYYLRRWSNTGIQNTHVERINVHPEFNAQTYTNDIAILKLTKPAEITDYVRTVCLWEGDPELNKVVGKHGTVVGWGFDEHGKVTEQLTKAKMPIVSQETCIYSFPDFYSRFTSNKTFCAGFQNGTSVCNGDSGGGLVIPKSQTNGNTNNPVWQLRGLVSISVALQNQLKCDSSHYVVFTDVAKYLYWIKAILNK